jgi:hypothetical protein
MKVDRKEFIICLASVSSGLSPREVLEQSNAFIFSDGDVITFNDEIMARSPCKVGFDAAVASSDFLKMLAKFPDKEIDIDRRKGDVVIKGTRRTAGVTCDTNLLLPFASVPAPDGWKKLRPRTWGHMLQASRTCGQDRTQYLTTCVHVAPQRIEGCDNYRLFRADGPTGFQQEILVPADAITAIEGAPIEKASIGKGWIYFGSGETVFSVRCSHEKYHDDIDTMLKVSGGELLELPDNLRDIVSRAEVMNEAGFDSRISVSIAGGILEVSSRKEGGWYKERRKVKYRGKDLAFDVNPKFLVDILGRTREVTVGDSRMRIDADNTVFVVSLDSPGGTEDAEDGSADE